MTNNITSNITYKNKLLYCPNCMENTYHEPQQPDNEIDNKLLCWSKLEVQYSCKQCYQSQSRNVYIFFHIDSNNPFKVGLG